MRCNSAVDRWCIKIDRVKKFLKGWGQSLRGHSKKYRGILQEELLNLEKLEEDGPLPSHLLEWKTFIQTEMLRLCEEEEAYWHKRSNMNWLLKGDLNTDYFHRVANGKKKKNHIFSLRQDDKIIESDENILQIATDYFKSLFGPSNSPICKMDPSCWSPEEKVSQEESEQLNSKFSEEEIKNVVFSMEKNTAPGPDHIPVEFFQTC